MIAPADDPRERLNYFNGQRLAASDFRAEQGHHDGTRRLLNHALYSSGIVTGLEVEGVAADKHRVKVRRGLAFDHLGREIFLPQDVLVQAMGAPSATKGVVFGNLLVISYREQRKTPVSDGCAQACQVTPCRGDLAWGAPSRSAADAVFEVLDSWPAYESGKVVIAQLELNKSCQVVRVLPDARQYAMPVKAQKVRPISLGGEKDIDIANEKTLHFHIEDGAPERAVLILRAREFSSTYYTEIGEHVHPLDLKIEEHKAIPDHKHELAKVKTDSRLDPQTLKFKAWVWPRWPDPWDPNPHQPFAFQLWQDPGTSEQDLDSPPSSLGPHLRITGTKHFHGFAANMETAGAGAFGPLPHVFNKQVTESFGSTAVVPPPHQLKRNRKPQYTYIRDLHVVLDGNRDITDAILAQLARRPGQAARWKSLGNGFATHAIASDEGTGEIDLLALGFELGMGAHRLSLRLVPPKAGDPDHNLDPALSGDRGGRIHYNLYID